MVNFEPRRQLVHKTKYLKTKVLFSKSKIEPNFNMNFPLFVSVLFFMVSESCASPFHWKKSKRSFLDKFQIYPNEVSIICWMVWKIGLSVHSGQPAPNFGPVTGSQFHLHSLYLSVVWLNILSARTIWTIEILQSNAWYHGLAFIINCKYTQMYRFKWERLGVSALVGPTW